MCNERGKKHSVTENRVELLDWRCASLRIRRAASAPHRNRRLLLSHISDNGQRGNEFSV